MNDSKGISMSRLVFIIILNLIITIAQITGGIISGSLALISDAIHNLSDSISVAIAWFAQLLSRKPSTKKFTFGYKRAEIMAAFINAFALIGISVYLIFEAIERLIKPIQVDPGWMFWLGLLGLIANGISVMLLEREKNKNINIKAAYLHLLGDALTSLAVIAGAALIYFFNIIWIDALVTIFIGFYLLLHTFVLLKKSVTILMQMAPPEIKIEEIETCLSRIEGIKSVHHIHVWNLTDKILHFEGHIRLENDIHISETLKISKHINQVLKSDFEIDHITLQYEYGENHDRICNC